MVNDACSAYSFSAVLLCDSQMVRVCEKVGDLACPLQSKDKLQPIPQKTLFEGLLWRGLNLAGCMLEFDICSPRTSPIAITAKGKRVRPQTPF